MVIANSRETLCGVHSGSSQWIIKTVVDKWLLNCAVVLTILKLV